MRDVIRAVFDRYEAYLGSEISTAIGDDDGMFARRQDGALDHYLSVGKSAIDVIARAMIAAGRVNFSSVLDLPSGAGRVTRHLKVFLPDADLFVGELDQRNLRFAAETFGAKTFDAPLDFEGTPKRQFDLIFVGSLVTHFDHRLFLQAVRYFIAALAPDGLLVLTTHGRRHDHLERTEHHSVDSARWRAVTDSLARVGFGYFPYDPNNPNYGVSLTAPSWLLRVVESDPAVHILSLQEAAWSNHQDVLVLQKTRT